MHLIIYHQIRQDKQEIHKLNRDKAQSNKIQSDLLEGDRVRILDKKLFKKGSEPQYSREIYTVESVHGKTICIIFIIL